MIRYYPLIRGRQFDLVALKDILAAGMSPSIIPIIEPVRDIVALPRVITAFARAKHPLYVITNPQVGSYGLLQSPHYPLPPLTAPIFPARYFDTQPASLVLTTTKVQVRLATAAQTVVMPDEARFRALKHPRAVYLTDHYPTREHTADYYDRQTDFYQYAKVMQPGAGFADYPLSTHEYFEHGYPQKAIALHLLFADHSMLYLRHFVSVNNDDYSDPAAKFFEALAPLSPWLQAHPQANTPATKALLALGATHHFPGLGTLRKLQLEHWLTIMDRWLTK